MVISIKQMKVGPSGREMGRLEKSRSGRKTESRAALRERGGGKERGEENEEGEEMRQEE